MKIPRRLTIGGRKIRVKFVDFPDDSVGVADYENGLILIKKKMKRSAQEATFMHELFHHMNTTAGHALLDSLAEQTYHVLKANKMLR